MPMPAERHLSLLIVQILASLVCHQLCSASSLPKMSEDKLSRSLFDRWKEEKSGGDGTARGDGDGVVRYHQLLNRCSQKYVLLTSKGVNARSAPGNIHSHLRFVGEETGNRLRIQNSRTGSHLCFNKKGRLVVKFSGREIGCLFHEVHSIDHFTEIQSAANGTWFISFKKNGQPMDGSQWSRRPALHKCKHFTKSQFAYAGSSDEERTIGNGENSRHAPIGLDYQRLFVRLKNGKRR